MNPAGPHSGQARAQTQDNHALLPERRLLHNRSVTVSHSHIDLNLDPLHITETTEAPSHFWDVFGNGSGEQSMRGVIGSSLPRPSNFRQSLDYTHPTDEPRFSPESPLQVDILSPPRDRQPIPLETPRSIFAIFSRRFRDNHIEDQSSRESSMGSFLSLSRQSLETVGQGSENPSSAAGLEIMAENSPESTLLDIPLKVDVLAPPENSPTASSDVQTSVSTPHPNTNKSLFRSIFFPTLQIKGRNFHSRSQSNISSPIAQSESFPKISNTANQQTIGPKGRKASFSGRIGRRHSQITE